MFHVLAEAVERHRETRDMEDIAEENPFGIEAKDGSATAEDRDERVVAHANAETGDRPIGDEGRFIGDHVICGTGVGDSETAAGGGMWRAEGETLKQSRKVAWEMDGPRGGV